MLSNGTILDPAGNPLNGRYRTLKDPGEALSAADLIRHAQEHPPQPMIKGLLYKGDILLLHGSEESFKSVFILQMAESLSKGIEFLNWKVPQARRVGVIETELHEVMLGERLAKMFPGGDPPQNLLFMGEEALRGWRRLGLRAKFESIQKWVEQNRLEALMIDTANDFFRGEDNPSDERNVGEFFDELRSMKVDGRIIVRHDRKKSIEVDGRVHSNERIRGSSEWKEDPEAIIAIQRPDRRTHAAFLEVGKLRYGAKPDPFTVWFDKKAFRLTPLPPVIDVLSVRGNESRDTIVAQCEERFGMCERTVAHMIAQWGTFLKERMVGHSKEFEIDLDKVANAPWCRFLIGD
jgi:AAA domain